VLATNTTCAEHSLLLSNLRIGANGEMFSAKRKNIANVYIKAAQLGSLKLSIALLAYNRERFLAKQLESIVAQSRLPDELVIGDDCSTDRTVEIISDFAAHAPFPVQWYVNERNQGVSRNAEHAIRLCSGDVIVLCDDDDVCLPEKLRVTEEEFLRSSATGLMVSNSALVDENLSPSGITLWDAHKFTAREAEAVLKDPICTLASHFIAYGHVISFRASLRDYVLPFPETFAVRKFFDVWVALVLASVANVACIPEPLVLHRLHRGQIAGVQSLVSSRERIAIIRSRERENIAEFVPLVEEVIDRISTLTDVPIAQRNLESLTRWAGHMKMQSELSARRRTRICPIAHALLAGQYHRYSRGFLTAARDLLLLH
jgi:glycosyltransferase involved in cell wall biosynthesis